jgi:hypothetical protein
MVTDDELYGNRSKPYHFIGCMNCGAHGPLEKSKSDAMEKWNTRLMAVVEVAEYD